MKIQFSSSREKNMSHFFSRFSRDRDSCQWLVWTIWCRGLTIGSLRTLPAWALLDRCSCTRVILRMILRITGSTSWSSTGTGSRCRSWRLIIRYFQSKLWNSMCSVSSSHSLIISSREENEVWPLLCTCWHCKSWPLCRSAAWTRSTRAWMLPMSDACFSCWSVF